MPGKGPFDPFDRLRASRPRAGKPLPYTCVGTIAVPRRGMHAAGEGDCGDCRMTIERFDSLSIRCIKLGGPVTFEYCRKLNDGLPCASVVGCWAERFDVASFLKRNYPPAELQRAFAVRRARMDLIAGAVERAERERREQQRCQ